MTTHRSCAVDNEQKLVEYLKRATVELGEARARAAELEAKGHEPIAIVGMACRFPGGVTSPAELWDLVAAGRDATSGFPADRGWDLTGVFDHERPGGHTTGGGFLDDIAGFDADLFGISPREALDMDPQQRLMLEVSWEALESAGIGPSSVRGSSTGVFAGVMYHDWGAWPSVRPEGASSYVDTGSLTSVVSGRISYCLGLEGPAVSIDTACSSSLVALHLARQALLRGECALALAGGVTVMTTPDSYADSGRQGSLPADGRCKSYGDGADGVAWGEGVGVLLLERLSDARRNGRRVLAVVRGSAVNQDGASSGLSVPNGPAQQRVIRQALADAGLSASDVDLVEGHGTGTTLGDPIEAHALLATYGQARDRPLWLGSVKSNLGHPQAAAGVAGVIKTVQAMRHGVLPKTLHAGEPSRQVEWSSGAVELLAEARTWPENGRPRRAGVSSFGFSGTNAHVIIEQAPDPVVAPEPPVGPPAAVPLVLSGKTSEAVRAQAKRLLERMNNAPDLGLEDVAYSLATTRSLQEHRAAIVVRNREEALTSLDTFSKGHPVSHAASGVADVDGGVVFVFPGQGTHWAGMCAELLETSPVFARRMAECADALAPHVDWSLLEVARGTADTVPLDRVDVTQPLSFATMVSLAELWASCGVRPDAVVGHSQGEVAAACVAGALSLADAAKVIAVRSQAIARSMAGWGGMAWVLAAPEHAEALIAPWADAIGLAAVNGPESVAVSGEAGALREFLARCKEKDVRAGRVVSDFASHTWQMERVEDEVLAGFAGLRPRTPAVPFFSSVDQQWIAGDAFDARYWYRNMRRPVLFGPSVEVLLEQEYRAFVEVSPASVLTATVRNIAESAAGVSAAVVETLRARDGGLRRMYTSLGHLSARGVPVDWAAVFAGSSARAVELPTYAFQRRRYWPERRRPAGDVSRAGLVTVDHPFLGAVVRSPTDDGVTLTGRLSVSTLPWLAEHALWDRYVLPGTGFLELAIKAGDQVSCGAVEELTLEAPLLLPEHGGVAVQVVVRASDETGRRTVDIFAQRDGEETWTRHASGVLAAESRPTTPVDLTTWPPPGATAVNLEGGYEALSRRGYGYGPVFQGLRAMWRRDDTVFAEVSLPEHARAAEFGLHPALLDAALHSDLVGRDGPAEIPFVWSGVALYASGASALRVRIDQVAPGEVALAAADASGSPVASVRSLVARNVSADQLGPAGRDGSLFSVGWHRLAGPPPGPAPANWAVLGSGDAMGLPRHPDLAALVSGGKVPDAVVYCVPESGTEDDVPTAVRAGIRGLLELLQGWLREERLSGAQLVVATRNAAANLEHASLWGLVRAAEAENPGRFVLVDVDGSESSWRALPGVVAAGEPEAAIRDGVLTVPRLDRVQASEPGGWNTAGTVLITGGTGGLGALVARHLVGEHGVRHLVLASRSGRAAPGAGTLCADLEQLGAEVRIVACDVADRVSVENALAEVDPAHPLTGVVHAAGVADAGLIAGLDAGRIDRVARPKVDGAWHLHELTRDLDLSVFVLFSSAAGLVLSAGQGGYAAANAFLDALAEHRRTLGLPAVSLAWGLWSGTGMGGQTGATDLTRLERMGITGLSAEEGLALFDAAVGLPGAVLAPIKIAPSALRARSGPALLRGLGRPSVRPESERDMLAALGPMSEQDRHRTVLDLVRRQVAAVLGHDDLKAVEPRRGFISLGLDSLAAVELRNQLSAATGLRLAATLTFDYPSPLEVTVFLLAELFPDVSAADSDSAAESRVRAALASVPLAALRAAGLLDSLLELAAAGSRAPGDPAADHSEAIKSMTAEDLVRTALGAGADDLLPE
ncbi:type I polyketide synthase [Amycolatopsis sp. NPDC059235]|uniref:type I polyketide synthase n=1 Tax=Amycolatopsis sp. NPDC059235 TaxID=3346782 RepID=UPI0036734E2D